MGRRGSQDRLPTTIGRKMEEDDMDDEEVNDGMDDEDWRLLLHRHDHQWSAVLLIISVLDLNVSEKPQPVTAGIRRYDLSGRGIEAERYEDQSGFVVLAGSQVARETVPFIPAYCSPNGRRCRSVGTAWRGCPMADLGTLAWNFIPTESTKTGQP
jgi:hypothetical protein